MSANTTNPTDTAMTTYWIEKYDSGTDPALVAEQLVALLRDPIRVHADNMARAIDAMLSGADRVWAETFGGDALQRYRAWRAANFAGVTPSMPSTPTPPTGEQ